MSLATLSVSKDYGLVIAGVASTFFLNSWHMTHIGAARKAAKIFPPKILADSGDLAAAKSPEERKLLEKFNRTERAHGNYLESQPSVVAAMLIAGIPYPRTTAALGAAWIVGRILYTLGYIRDSEKPGSGRLRGFGISVLTQHLLFGLAGWAGVQLFLQ